MMIWKYQLLFAVKWGCKDESKSLDYKNKTLLIESFVFIVNNDIIIAVYSRL